MLQKTIAVLAVFFALSLSAFAQTTFTQGPSLASLSLGDQDCMKKMSSAVDQYIASYRGAPPKSVEVVEFNDLSCTGPEWGANIALTIESPDGTSSWFGIFRVRFLPDGSLRNMATLAATWTRMRSSFSWLHDWCGVLKTNYPSDYQRSCVPKPDPLVGK